jgi:hypothetical protein
LHWAVTCEVETSRCKWESIKKKPKKHETRLQSHWPANLVEAKGWTQPFESKDKNNKSSKSEQKFSYQNTLFFVCASTPSRAIISLWNFITVLRVFFRSTL